jgi:hypothetical protein
MKSVPFLLSSISAVISERNQPGAMGVHPDAAAGPLSGEFPGEVDDRALGSGVGGLGNRRQATRPSADAILMIDPDPCAIMTRAARWLTVNRPMRFTSGDLGRWRPRRQPPPEQ